MRIFISYRRDDSMLGAAYLYEQLTARFGKAQVFMDVDDIGYGDDFIDAIDRELAAADVVLVVIGPRWVEMLQARLRGDDWVRHEVETALRLRAASAEAGRRVLRVIPVLVGGAAPPADKLAPTLRPLQRLSMIKIDERALGASVTTLLEAIREESFEEEAARIRHEVSNARRLRIAGLLVGLATFLGAWMAVFDLVGLDTRAATATMLLAGLAAPREAWSGEVVLVGIDEGSEKSVGRKFDSSWRAEHARVVGQAASAGARVLAFDMVLEDPGVESADAALAQALARTREKMPVVFGVQRASRSGPRMRPEFAPLVRQGVACAGVRLGQARAMPLAVQRAAAPEDAASAVRAAAPIANRVVVRPSLALAALSGSARAEPLDEGAQEVVVRVRGQHRLQAVAYYAAETVGKVQADCDLIGPGDRVAMQLIDPLDLPALRSPPQRLAYEQVLAGDAAVLALLKDRIVLVGVQLADRDRHALGWPVGERWGVDLIAGQVDAMTRREAIRPLGGVAQWLLMTGLGGAGAYVAYRLRGRSRLWRVLALAAIAVVFVVAAAAWYRTERQLVGLPYGLVALALGAWLSTRVTRRRPT